MCRSIKILRNLDPAVTDDDIEKAALQFVRKISGYRAPSRINENTFNQAVIEISKATKTLLKDLDSNKNSNK